MGGGGRKECISNGLEEEVALHGKGGEAEKERESTVTGRDQEFTVCPCDIARGTMRPSLPSLPDERLEHPS